MATSRRSKPSMASAIDTATAEATSPPPETATPGSLAYRARTAGVRRADATPGRRQSRRAVQPMAPRWPLVSPLTRRIVAVNVLPLALLALGFLYLGRFEASLIGQQIESLHMQGQIFAAALSEGAVLDSADEGEVAASRAVAPNDAPAGRADPDARPPVRCAGAADRRQPCAARARRPGAGDRTGAAEGTAVCASSTPSTTGSPRSRRTAASRPFTRRLKPPRLTPRRGRLCGARADRRCVTTRAPAGWSSASRFR